MSSIHWKNRNSDANAYSNLDDPENIYPKAKIVADPVAHGVPHTKVHGKHEAVKFQCSYMTCAITTILIFGSIIAIVLGAAGVFGTITYTNFVKGVADPHANDAMLTPTKLNAAVSDIYATLHNIQVLSGFMKNFTEQLHQQMPLPETTLNSNRKLQEATSTPSPFFKDGSYGAAMVQHLVGITASLQNVSQHVQPEAIGQIMTSTGNLMASLNATEFAPTVQGLLSHVSTVVQKAGEGIQPQDLQLLLHNTAELSVKNDLLPRVDKGMGMAAWMLQALHTPMPESEKK